MIRIQEIQTYYRQFSQEPVEQNIPNFIKFIEGKQKNMRGRVISWEARESARRLKELEARQAENKPVDPEEDFDNL